MCTLTKDSAIMLNVCFTRSDKSSSSREVEI